MKTKKGTSILNNDDGMALIESLPLLIIFVVLMSYGLGMWGATHRGILSSISARTYAFQTFRNRTNLSYHKDTPADKNPQFRGIGFRFHGIQSYNASSEDAGFFATKLPLAFGQGAIKQHLAEREPSSRPQLHNESIHNLPQRNREVGVNPIWIMVGYGMCISADCGGSDE